MSGKRKNKTEPAKHSKSLVEKAETEKRNLWIASAIIAVLTIIVYLQVFSNGFVNYDDDRYIENQPLIHSFDLKALFTQYVMGNYHPLVMMVYTCLYHFFGLNPIAYHSLNLIIHLVNTILVLWLLYYLTRSLPVSVIVSLLFGVHPLHVESVAWASELKDLMYTLGFLSSLIFYVRYIRENQRARLYIFCLLFFLFSLFSKGMGVSLTLVLFLVDFYLGRKFTVKTIIEKIPFFVLSVLFGIIAIYAQQSLGAIKDATSFTIIQRLAFACCAFVTYIQRIFLPFNLCAYYPYPVKGNDTFPAEYYLYPVVLMALLAGVFYSLRKNKKIFFGVGFFAITVALVLQLIPVGAALTADRYTYIPSIGIFFLIAEGIVYLLNRNKYSGAFNSASLGVLTVLALFFSYLTFNQVKLWKDGMTLWTNVINHYQTVSLAYNNRGVLYQDAGDYPKAMDDFSRSLDVDPTNSDTWCNKGLILWQEALADEANKKLLSDSALKCMNKAIEIKPDFAIAYGSRGSMLSVLGNQQGAINDFTKSIELDPNSAESYFDRGIVNYNLGNKQLACPDLKRAAELGYPRAADAYRDLCK